MFTVRVSYSGTPQPITDPDESIEGWIPACYPLAAPQTCDGAFVVSEPMGAQSWFPSNNYPTDKATFDTSITVPQRQDRARRRRARRQRATTATARPPGAGREDDPTATYLDTATIGDFDYTESSMTETLTGRTLPVYNAIDSSATPAQPAAIQASLGQAPAR